MIQALRAGLEATPLLEEVLPAAVPMATPVEAVDFEPALPPVPDWLRGLAEF